MTYKKSLRVSTPEGKRIEALITPGETVNIMVPFLECVAEDNPKFAKNGIIRISIPRDNYVAAIVKIEAYLESLFLKELQKDVNTSPSVKTKPKPRRAKKADTPREVEPDKGEGNSPSIHSGPRGDNES